MSLGSRAMPAVGFWKQEYCSDEYAIGETNTRGIGLRIIEHIKWRQPVKLLGRFCLLSGRPAYEAALGLATGCKRDYATRTQDRQC